MGIRDEFHQNSILSCIDELKTGLPVYDLKPPALLAKTDSGVITATASKKIHEMIQFSFSELKKCEQCQKYLRGIVHQGMLCKKCGIVAHRTCARLGMQTMHCTYQGGAETALVSAMAKASATSLQQTFSVDPTYASAIPIFGISLCKAFDFNEHDAPEVLRICCSQIEAYAKQNTDTDLYRLYQNNLSSQEMTNFLRMNVSGGMCMIDFANHPVQCTIAMLKKYLRELPDPVIPVQFYDCFIKIASM